MQAHDEPAPLQFSKLKPIALAFSNPSEQSISDLARLSKPMILEFKHIMLSGQENVELEEKTYAYGEIRVARFN